MPLVFGKSLYLHTLFFTVISLKTYRIDMSKILIIDDEVQIRTLLTRMMELEGYDVCQAGDCRAALKQLELQNPDVVLCDVFLPDGNGVDLVLAIKKAAPNVEVILLTAHGNIPDGVQAIKNGAFDYITKGDDNNKIIPLISRAVEKARMNVRLEKLEKKVGQTYSFDSILGESKVLKDAVSLAQKVSGGIKKQLKKMGLFHKRTLDAYMKTKKTMKRLLSGIKKPPNTIIARNLIMHKAA